MPRILITGSEGGLGRAWARKLAASELAPALPGPVEVIALQRARLDVAALNAANQVLEEVRPDVVLNCAGRWGVEACESSSWEAYRANRDGAEQVAKACARVGALPVNFSSSMVFDGAKLHPYGEEDAPNPLNKLGESKLAGELRTAGGSHRHLIIRTGWLYGQPGRDFVTPLFGEEPFDVIESQACQATWIEDFMEAVLFLLRQGKTGRWHVASPGAATQEEMIKTARGWLGREGPPFHTRRLRARLPLSVALGVSKLSAAGVNLGPWKERLEAYIRSLAQPTRPPRARR